jgi:hypothetical protein
MENAQECVEPFHPDGFLVLRGAFTVPQERYESSRDRLHGA